MVLADTLAWPRRNKPKLIIDYATLTGACVYAIGKTYSGVFTNQGRVSAPDGQGRCGQRRAGLAIPHG